MSENENEHDHDQHQHQKRDNLKANPYAVIDDRVLDSISEGDPAPYKIAAKIFTKKEKQNANEDEEIEVRQILKDSYTDEEATVPFKLHKHSIE